ncbi:MAG: hypothetical protein FWF78_05640, partial [Defluviitaleaceae bacterium]|nr:hypothetical protein [Defluviitaleaceae bacterium]
MKFLLIAIILAAFTACNNGNEDDFGTAEFTTPQTTETPPQTSDVDIENTARMVRENVTVATINSIPVSAGEVTFIIWEAWNTL